jgi:hypothetical protein
MVIARPVEEVFAFMTEPQNQTQWRKGVVESVRTSEGPLGVGAAGKVVWSSMGGMTSDWTCTAWELDRRFAFRVTKPISFDAEYRFEAVSGGTRVEVEAEPQRFFRLLWPLARRYFGKEYAADLATIKGVLEAQP